MTETAHPFIDDGNGLPTDDSVRKALDMFQLGRLANLPVHFKDQDGTVVDLITHCPIRHLTQNWPKDFIGQVVGIVAQASQVSRPDPRH